MLVRESTDIYGLSNAERESRHKKELLLYSNNNMSFLFDSGNEVARMQRRGPSIVLCHSPIRSYLKDNTMEFIKDISDKYPEFGQYILFNFDRLF